MNGKILLSQDWLIDSFPKILRAVIKSKGASSKWAHLCNQFKMYFSPKNYSTENCAPPVSDSPADFLISTQKGITERLIVGDGRSCSRWRSSSQRCWMWSEVRSACKPVLFFYTKQEYITFTDLVLCMEVLLCWNRWKEGVRVRYGFGANRLVSLSFLKSLPDYSRYSTDLVVGGFMSVFFSYHCRERSVHVS